MRRTPGIPFIGFLTALLLLSALQTRAQSPIPPIIFDRITTREGLVHNVVRSVFQDRDGYLWIGTADGLQRYDGREFRTWPSSPEAKPHTLSNGIIQDVHQDREGFIWASTEVAGYNRIDPQDGAVTRYDHRHRDDIPFSADRVNQTLPMPDGRVFLSTLAGMYLRDTNDVVRFVGPDSSRKVNPTTRVCYHLLDDYQGRIWLATPGGINLYYPEEDRYETVHHNPLGIEALNVTRSISDIYFDGPTKLWIATWEPALYRYDLSTNRLDTIDYAVSELWWHHVITSMCRDQRGNFWAGQLDAGLLQLDPKRKFMNAYSGDPNIPASNIDSQIWSIHEDRQGNVWLGSRGGLYKFNPAFQPFRIVPPYIHGIGQVERPDFTHIMRRRNGDILLSTGFNGLLKLNPDFSFTQIEVRYPEWSSLTKFTSAQEGPGGRLWLATSDGLVMHDPATGRSRLVSDPPNLLPSFIWEVEFDGAGNLWTFQRKSVLVKLDPKTLKATRYDLKNPYDDPLGCGSTSIEFGDSNTVWISTNACGLQAFHVDPFEFRQIIIPDTGNTETRGFGHQSTDHLYWQGDSLYVGTHSSGFGIMNLKTGEISNYSGADGMSSNRIRGFLPVADALWLFTENGISRMDLQRRSFENFGRRIGLIDLDFRTQPIHGLDGQSVLAATSSYLVTFHPDSVRPLPSAPLPTLQAVNLFDRQLPVDSLLQMTEPLTIPYSNNLLTLEFASIDFLQANEIEYAWKLEGYNDAWVRNGNSRRLRLADLPGGEYRLWLRSRGMNREWNPGTRLFRIYVTTPFWQQWWFYLGIGLLVIGIGWVIYRSRINRLMAVMRIRNRISRDLHDEVGSSLSSISIISQLLLSGNAIDPEKAQSLLTRINAHSLTTMESMDDIIWAIHPDNDQTDKLLIRMRQFAADLLESAEIAYRFEAGEGMEGLALNLDQKWNCWRIFKELLNNIAKHAQASNAHIRFERQQRTIRLEVTDDGIGFDPDAKTSRNGIRNMRERAAAVQGRITFASPAEGGSKIVLEFPL